MALEVLVSSTGCLVDSIAILTDGTTAHHLSQMCSTHRISEDPIGQFGECFNFLGFAARRCFAALPPSRKK